jgi:hypothetical protein
MVHLDPNVNLWSLSSAELAAACRSLAEDPDPIDSNIQAEARLLLFSWRETLQMHGNRFDDRARKEAMLAALRKRTIEITLKARAQA